MRATAGGGGSNVVDVYNVATGAWSAAQLSVARVDLAAASVGNVALFAGGETTSALVCREEEGGGHCVLLRACFVFCVWCGIAALFALRPLPLSCAPLQVMVIPPLLWMCTTLQREHGRRLTSAWRANILQLHLSGTWLCSLGVTTQTQLPVVR